MLRAANQCLRKHYWGKIRNLNSNGLYLPFYTGGLIHLGIESFYLGKSPKKVIKIVKKEIKLQSSILHIRDNMIGKKRIQDAVILGSLKGFMQFYRTEPKTWRLEYAEKPFRIQLPDIPVRFKGILDLVYSRMYKGKRILGLGEHKSAAQINDNQRHGLHQNSQVQLYNKLLKVCTDKDLHECSFNVLQKSKRRLKKDQTFDELVEEISEEYTEEPEKFFYRNRHLYKQKYLDAAWDNLLVTVEALFKKYYDLSENQILDPVYWPKNTDACFDYYTRCEYFELCKHGDYPQGKYWMGEKEDYYGGEEKIQDDPETEELKKETRKRWKKTKFRHRRKSQ